MNPEELPGGSSGGAQGTGLAGSWRPAACRYVPTERSTGACREYGERKENLEPVTPCGWKTRPWVSP